MGKQKKKVTTPVSPELAKRVKNLWDKDENSAHDLGKALDEVKKCNPRQFMKWIEKNLGDSPSIRNRCSYCLRVFRGKIPPKGKTGNTLDIELGKIIHEVNDRFKQLWDYAKAGDVDPAIVIGKKINEKVDELLETAKSREKEKEQAKATTA
jgi:hypothetical protein